MNPTAATETSFLPNTYELLELDAGGASAGAMTPGRVLRALALGANIPAEQVGLIEPAGPGRVTVEIDRLRAAHLTTPRLLPCDDGGLRAVFVLRREDDLPDEGRFEVLIEAPSGAPAPSPGAVARALAPLGLHAEDLGFGLDGAGFVRLSLPLRAARLIPASLSIDGVTHAVENLLKKP